MENYQIAEMLKEKIQDVELSKKNENPNNRIVIIHLSSDIFLKMAKLFIVINSK